MTNSGLLVPRFLRFYGHCGHGGVRWRRGRGRRGGEGRDCGERQHVVGRGKERERASEIYRESLSR